MFDFVGNIKKFLICSSTLFVIAIVFACVFGIKLDIQFSGGVIANYSYTGEVNVDAVQKNVEAITKKSATIQTSTDAKSNKLIVSLATKDGLSPEMQEAMTKSLQTEFADNKITMTEISSVEAGIGHDFFYKSLVAVGFAALAIIVFVAWRFKKIKGWSAGVMSVVALVHDVLMVFATFIILQIPINGNFVAVVLTILGYSINDTIVIYDRIRENKRLQGNKISNKDLVNKSINQSLTRSINTTLTTVAVMVVVGVVSVIYGVTSIVSFAFPMIVGMISGVYSTLCIAGPLWSLWQDHKLKKKQTSK